MSLQTASKGHSAKTKNLRQESQHMLIQCDKQAVGRMLLKCYMVFTTQRYTSMVYAVAVCLSVSVSLT